MKILTILGSLLLSYSLMAENNGKHVNEGFLKTAREYDAKAERAANSDNAHNAAIYKKLAAIKREAAVSTNGYDWGEYHKLNGQLNHDHKKANHEKKKNKPSGFESAAQRYDHLSKKALDAGDPEKAATYARLAGMKREAQKAGGNYDWTEYRKLNSQLNNGDNKEAKKKKPMRKEKMKEKVSPETKMNKKVVKKTTRQATPTNYISSAQKHAELANKSSAAKDNYSAQIHTRLAAILIDAAAKQSENRVVDWTEYNELKELLGK
ncbi:MAG: hypothetical protein ACI9FG_002033 [Crocinitomicaceae bacterium]|jgi:hypothetical protein